MSIKTQMEDDMINTDTMTEIETTLRPMAENYTTWEAFIWENHADEGTYAGLARVMDLPFSEDEFDRYIERERDTTKRPGEQIVAATIIQDYRRPSYLVEPVRVLDTEAMAWLRTYPWSIRTRTIRGWGDANAIVRVGDDGWNVGNDYLVRLEVPA